MKITIATALAIVITVFGASGAAMAQDHSRSWENGSVVAVTNVHIKPGMFNAYINDLNSLWRKSMELQMEDGGVLGYNMYANPSTREGEPDLILTVTYENWAAFDKGIEYFEEISEKLIGSMDNMREAAVDREALRTIGSTYTLQEIKFKD